MQHKSLALSVIATVSLLAMTGGHAQPSQSDDRRDWSGMRRDLYYLIGWQVVATGIIYHAPFEFSNWNEAEKDALGFEQWGDNVTHPVWDEDHWAVNYVLHPYWGAAYYIRGRERGFSRKESFWVAALYSTVYEFGIESFLEEPSIQDIVVTPVVGAALGIYFEKVRERIRSRSGPLSFADRTKLALTDPLGALNRSVNRLFGIRESSGSQVAIGFRPVRSISWPEQAQPGNPRSRPAHEVDGFELTISARR